MPLSANGLYSRHNLRSILGIICGTEQNFVGDVNESLLQKLGHTEMDLIWVRDRVALNKGSRHLPPLLCKSCCSYTNYFFSMILIRKGKRFG